MPSSSLHPTPAIFGYGRVSTSDQSADNQRLELQEAGYRTPASFWFADVGISGKVSASQRPQFARLLDKIREGETLVVAKLDRLGRDSMDVEATLQMLEQRGVSVVVLQLGKTDLTSTAGKLIRKVLAAVADMERDLLVERTQAGLQRAKAEGKTLGRPAKTTEQQRAEIRALVQAGQASISEVARRYAISRASVHAVLKQPGNA